MGGSPESSLSLRNEGDREQLHMCPSSVLPTDFPKRPGRKALCILCANKGDSISLLLVSQKLAPGEMADFSLGQGKYKWSLEQLVVPESKALLKKKTTA